MEEEKAAAYYDELTRKGGGAARFKQGLGFSSFKSQKRRRTYKTSILNPKVYFPKSTNTNLFMLPAVTFPLRSMAVFSLKFVAGIEWPKNSVHSLLSSLRVVLSSAVVVLEEKALDFRPNYARFRAFADKCDLHLFSCFYSHMQCFMNIRILYNMDGNTLIWGLIEEKKVPLVSFVFGFGRSCEFNTFQIASIKHVHASANWYLDNVLPILEKLDAPLDDEELEVADDDVAIVKYIGQSFRFSAIEARREEQIKVAHVEAMFGTSAVSPSVSGDSELEVDNSETKSNEGGLATSLLSEKVLAKQQGSWHDRARKG
ncbi:hypothetical protein Q3G72_020244 [Acer saccharum]|nr:hypothetical protein Q3G72_020244 [Acer saccharum]